MTAHLPSTRLVGRTIVRLAPTEPGENVIEFVQGLVTQDVAETLPVWAGLLSPQGKVLFDFMVWPAGEGLLLDCEAEAADLLVRRLSLYRLRRKIAIVRDDMVAVHWRQHERDGTAADPRLPALGQRWLAPADAAAVVAQGADDAWLAHRLSLGVTEGRAELGDGETLWLECNAAELNGVSFTKGCYVGQENTARMNWRQKVNRRLVVVPLPASDPARQRATYPALGLAVDHRRVEDIGPELMPDWMAAP